MTKIQNDLRRMQTIREKLEDKLSAVSEANNEETN